MGFFNKIASTILGKKESESDGLGEGTSYAATLQLTSRDAAPIAGATANGHHSPLAAAQPNGGAAVAVAGPSGVFKPVDAKTASAVEQLETDLFDGDIEKDLDDVFDFLLTGEAIAQAPSPGSDVYMDDQVVVENLFAEIASNYARPVKNFIFELKRGTATREWIEICRPAMHGITRAAKGMDLGLVAERMNDFEAALSLAQQSEDRILSGEIRDLLLWCYEDMAKVMPQAFIIGEEEQLREGIIINSLLKQVPDLGRVTVEKLYRAGLTSLDTLFLAKKDDLAVATGIPVWLSERICQKFEAYRAELQGDSRDVAHSGRGRLSELLVELRRQHAAFEEAAENERAAEKREYRQQRQSCLLRINVLLAEMGELDLVNELQKLSFDRRIQQLEEYLASPPTVV